MTNMTDLSILNPILMSSSAREAAHPGRATATLKKRVQIKEEANSEYPETAWEER